MLVSKNEKDRLENFSIAMPSSTSGRASSMFCIVTAFLKELVMGNK